MATSHWYLRIYSSSGIQKGVLSLAGPVVAMAGHANHLIVVYHRASGKWGKPANFVMITLQNSMITCFRDSIVDASKYGFFKFNMDFSSVYNCSYCI